MTSKRELRERIADLTDSRRNDWDEGFTYAKRIFAHSDNRPWAEHVAAVAAAAKAEGFREGYGQACEDWSAKMAPRWRTWPEMLDTDLTASEPLPVDEPAPKADRHAAERPEGAQGDRCGFACCCNHAPAIPVAFGLGSVTR